MSRRNHRQNDTGKRQAQTLPYPKHGGGRRVAPATPRTPASLSGAGESAGGSDRGSAGGGGSDDSEYGDADGAGGGDDDDYDDDDDGGERQHLPGKGAVNNTRRNKSSLSLWLADVRQWLGHLLSGHRDSNPIWRKKIKKIEGRFGGGVSSFFQFTRFILELNIVLFTISFSFVTLPMLVHHVNRGAAESDHSFSVLNVFDGKGKMGASPMFFGGYTVFAGSYRMDVAYILVMTMLMFCLVYFLIRLFLIYRRQQLQRATAATDTQLVFSLCVQAARSPVRPACGLLILAVPHGRAAARLR